MKKVKIKYFVMHKKTIGIILIITFFFIVGIIFWGVKQSKDLNASSAVSDANAQADVIYYYGRECPHCLNIEKFISENKIEEKISFAKKEVWHNDQNNAELQDRAKECGLEENKVGVPFLYARGKCYVGEIEVKNFLANEIGQK